MVQTEEYIYGLCGKRINGQIERKIYKEIIKLGEQTSRSVDWVEQNVDARSSSKLMDGETNGYVAYKNKKLFV